MRRKIKLMISVLCVSFFLASYGSDLLQAGNSEIVVSGRQHKGPGYQNAQKSGEAFTITTTMYITRVTGATSFWIEDGNNFHKSFQNVQDAINYELKPGTYNVYPRRPDGKAAIDAWDATVRVTLSPNKK